MPLPKKLLLLCSLLAPLCAIAQVTVKISPRQAPLTLKEAQQFTATVSNTTNKSVTWLVDGVAGGNSTTGTISTSGLYHPPANPGAHTVKVQSKASSSASASAKVWVTNYPGMMTYHADRFRSGVNSQELALTSSSVNKTGFGRLFTRAVDGQIYAQPLYVANLSIGGTVRNVVFVATEHDSVYAFDADGRTTSPLWKHSFLKSGVTTLGKPANGLISPEIGITGTPVIDQASNTIYVASVTVESGKMVHRLHALSATTGAEKFGGPIVVSGSYAGVTFDPSRHLQRPALLQVGSNIFVAFGSHGDAMPYQGWLFAYSASGGTLHQTGVFNASPTKGAAAIWMSGGGPAADKAGNVFLVTGNGDFSLNTGGNDAGNTFLKLGFVNGALSILDYYTPDNQAQLNASDWDLGNGGVMLPPFQSGAAAPNIVVCGGKDGNLYIVNRDNMGHFNATSDPAVQKLNLGTPGHNGHFYTPAAWNGSIYLGPNNEPLQAFRFGSGTLPSSASSASSMAYSYPGANPMVSANGSSSGIVWVLDNSKYLGGTPSGAVNTAGPAVLHAYRADNLSIELYNSAQAGSRDTAGTALKFTSPLIANGHVYVGGAKQLTVYGLLP